VTSPLRSWSSSASFGAAGLARASAAAGTFAAAVGALALTGWALDVDVLKGAGGAITMKPNAALGLVACGLSLRAYVSSRRAVRWLSPVLAVCGGAIGILTLSQHIGGWNLGIDELLFVEAPGSPATSSPARMGPVASFSLAAEMQAFSDGAGRGATFRLRLPRCKDDVDDDGGSADQPGVSFRVQGG
jgi:hypothetical protein